MFKKFRRWLAVFFDDVSGKPVSYEDRDVVIGLTRYRVLQGRTLDIHALLKMEREIYGSMPWDRTSFEIDMERPDSLYLILVDCETQAMVAFIGTNFNYYARDVHISNIGVLPAFQMHGLGTFLIKEIERKAVRDNFSSLSLEVRRSNKYAQRLYHHLGFITTQVRHHYYLDNGEDAFEMLKKLDHERK